MKLRIRLAKWLAGRVVVPQEVQKLSYEELLRAVSVPPNHPLWLAINQIVDEQIANAVSQVSSPDLAGDHGGLAHTAGGVEWLRAIKFRLTDLRDEAMSEADPEGKPKK